MNKQEELDYIRKGIAMYETDTKSEDPEIAAFLAAAYKDLKAIENKLLVEA